MKREIQDAPKPKVEPKVAGTDQQSQALIEILRQQLEIKDQQIAAQNDVIKGLSERVREGNVLMGSLQQRLAAPEQKKQNVVDSESVSTEKGTTAVEEQPKKTPWYFKKIF